MAVLFTILKAIFLSAVLYMRAIHIFIYTHMQREIEIDCDDIYSVLMFSFSICIVCISIVSMP